MKKEGSKQDLNTLLDPK